MRIRSRKEPRRGKHDREERRNGGAVDQQSPPRRRFGGNVGPGEERIEGGNEERQTVNAGYCSDLQQSGVRRSRVTEQVPGKTNLRQMRPGKLERHPKKRRSDAGEFKTAVGQTVHAQSEGADK